jgi:hypothetical protein
MIRPWQMPSSLVRAGADPRGGSRGATHMPAVGFQPSSPIYKRAGADPLSGALGRSDGKRHD